MAQPLADPFGLFVTEGDLHAAADQVVLFAVGPGEGLRRHGGGDLPHGLLVGSVREARV